MKEILDELRDAIVDLDIDEIPKLSRKALDSGVSAYDAIVNGMAKGMEIVGLKYEDGEYYLAELVLAGETMKEGMTVLEPYLEGSMISTAGKCVIGTVKGDLHDIGKNVFVSLLKAENFDVIDLGTDITPEAFMAAYHEHKPDIIAMSALLTITMGEMGKVIEELKAAGVRDKVKVLIGGAPITDEYAVEIGADAAAKDAVDGIRIIRQWAK
jgi:5-methyltetrahydrofolate--homocysteine methyltransferase